jgi:hypothetical protein
MALLGDVYYKALHETKLIMSISVQLTKIAFIRTLFGNVEFEITTLKLLVYPGPSKTWDGP